MTAPTCPQDYSCTFTLVHPRTINHTVGPWWQHTSGWIVAIIAIIAIACLLAWLMTIISDSKDATREKRFNSEERERQRQHDLAIEEQRTMQADAAKGNPEMLKIIREKI